MPLQTGNAWVKKYLSLIFYAPHWHDYQNASKQKQSNTQQTCSTLSAHGAIATIIIGSICDWMPSSPLFRFRLNLPDSLVQKQSSRSVKWPTSPPHLLTGVRTKSSKEYPKVFWKSKLTRILEDKKMAFEIIKPRFLFSCGPNIIKKEITNSPNMKQELCSSECPCLSKQSCSCFQPLRNRFWGLRFPIPCSWDLQSHGAEARLVLCIRIYNRSPPLQTQDYQLQLKLYLGQSTRFYKEL